MGSYYPTDYYTPEPNRQYQEQYSYRPQDPRYLVSASHSYTHTGGPISRSTSYFSNESGYPQYSASSSTSPQPPYAYPSTYQSSNTVPDVELTYGATIKSSNRQNKSPRSPAPAPAQYPCLFPRCGHISSRAFDLDRHMTTHYPPPPTELIDCPGRGCGRQGSHGFKRKDHLNEHLRKVHTKKIPKRGDGKSGSRGRSGSSGSSSG